MRLPISLRLGNGGILGPVTTSISRRGVLGALAGGAVAAAAGAAGAREIPQQRRFRARVVDPEEIVGMPTGTEVVFRAEPAGREVALTFDDGPDPRWTPLVLSLLQKHDGHATFFQVGQRAEAHRSLTAEVHAAGHEVANHTWQHRDVSTLALGEVRDQLRRTDDTLGSIIGRAPTLFRPPWGHIDGPGLLAATELGYRTVLWSHRIRTSDAESDSARDLAGASPGIVILCHDGGPTPADRLYPVVERFVATMRERGYRFVSVSTLLAAASAGSTA